MPIYGYSKNSYSSFPRIKKINVVPTNKMDIIDHLQVHTFRRNFKNQPGELLQMLKQERVLHYNVIFLIP